MAPLAPASSWLLHDRVAALRSGSVAACVDVVHPQRGLHSLEVSGAALAAELLCVNLPATMLRGEPLQVECFVRGADLVASYADDPDPRFGWQVYWRVASFAPRECLWAIELQVSMQTSLLESDAMLSVGSRFPAIELWQASDKGGSNFRPLSPDRNAPARFAAPQPAPCILARLAGGASYGEMVHPLDFRATSVNVARCDDEPGSTTQVETSHELFCHRLEKGVILRSRVLGVLVPRDGDFDLALACQRAFAATELPLTA